MEEISILLQIIGLSLDILGVIGLYFFGLPPDFDRHGQSAIIWNEENEEDKRKGRIYAVFSRLALLLIIIGFTLQIMGIAV